MDRRKALVAAATTAMTITAGSLALAANLGLLAHAEGDSVGKLNAKNVAELLDPGKGTKSPAAAPAGERPAETTAAPAPEVVAAPSGDDQRSGERHDDDRPAPVTAAPGAPTSAATAPTAPLPIVGDLGEGAGGGPTWTPPPTTPVPAPRPTTTERPEPSTTVPTSTTTEPRDDHDD